MSRGLDFWNSLAQVFLRRKTLRKKFQIFAIYKFQTTVITTKTTTSMTTIATPVPVDPEQVRNATFSLFQEKSIKVLKSFFLCIEAMVQQIFVLKFSKFIKTQDVLELVEDFATEIGVNVSDIVGNNVTVNVTTAMGAKEDVLPDIWAMLSLLVTQPMLYMLIGAIGKRILFLFA
jgi:hypothetical protein